MTGKKRENLQFIDIIVLIFLFKKNWKMCSDLDNCLKAIKIYTCSCLFDTLVVLTFLKIQCHEEIINKFNETFTQKTFSISLDHTINRMMICVESLGSFLFLFSLSINVLWTQLLNCIVRNVLENLYQNVEIIYQL